jgi:uncharacterized glyoxalase superfamily metalloenzyme YdcJ
VYYSKKHLRDCPERDQKNSKEKVRFVNSKQIKVSGENPASVACIAHSHLSEFDRQRSIAKPNVEECIVEI